MISLCPLPQLIIKPEAHRSLLGTAVAQGLPVQWGQPTKTDHTPQTGKYPTEQNLQGLKHASESGTGSKV